MNGAGRCRHGALTRVQRCFAGQGHLSFARPMLHQGGCGGPCCGNQNVGEDPAAEIVIQELGDHT
ncbi:hypothetical protein BB934_02705 [Microvirga ossetica]|uniref:Uncharacterized protein n=1 Tax=Microvirga ossetica TaxID=1882682 RepID=A0A1B2EBC4_9HYPH|nr:hypothetical protein BB934_02705 [Microvirga ossetica]